MRIDAFLTPFFPETEMMFRNNYVVMIDILRASTTVCSALFHSAKEVITTDTTEKAIKIYSGLSKESRFLGGERQGVKPESFDAGNSPSEYSEDKVKNKTVIFSTTNGTKTFLKAKDCYKKVVGAFVNFETIAMDILDCYRKKEVEEVFFLCSGTNGRQTYEDSLCAGAFINLLADKIENSYITDTAATAMSLFQLHAEDMLKFIKTREHAQYLINLGLERDVNECLSFDLYPVLPVIKDTRITNENNRII